MNNPAVINTVTQSPIPPERTYSRGVLNGLLAGLSIGLILTFVAAAMPRPNQPPPIGRYQLGNKISSTDWPRVIDTATGQIWISGPDTTNGNRWVSFAPLRPLK